MNKKIVGFAFLCLWIWVLPLQAQDINVRKYTNEFLHIGVGADALGMGNAAVAGVNNANAVFWNPAGLTEMEGDLQLSLMHAEYFAGIANFDFGGAGIRLNDRSVLGLGFIRFGVDDIPNTIELLDQNQVPDYSRVTPFSAIDYAFYLSYARRSTDSLFSFGTSAKVIHRTVGTFANAWGFGLDMGIQYRENGWQFAAMARDITTTFNAWDMSLTEREKEVFESTGNIIPENNIELTMPSLVLGVDKQFYFGERWGLRPEANIILHSDGRRNTVLSSDRFSLDPVAGLEFSYNNMIFLRGGIGKIQEEMYMSASRDGSSITFEPNLGIGLKISSFQVDYAYTDIGDQSIALYSHVVSLLFHITRSDKKAN